jgi:Mg-chelatase subunit ChlD
MNSPLDSLATSWLAAVLLALALLVLGVLVSLRRRLGNRFLLLALPAVGIGLAGLGGLVLSPTGGWWLGLAALSVQALMVVVLVLTGEWWPPLAWAAAALTLLAAGSIWLGLLTREITEAGRSLRDLEFAQPWWLLLLLVVPIIVLTALPRLNRSEWRPWVAVLLRSSLILLLAMALADPRLRQSSDRVTVLFVVDRSQSIPEELADDGQGGTVDRRARRVRDFINNAVRQRGPGHERDRAGLIVFGRRPRLELPPSDAPRFNLTDLPNTPDGNHTDIAAALKLALASFADDTGKRIVLVSDGNENMGNAEEQARLARTLGVQIDVLPLAAGQRNTDEILVERVDAPPVIEQGARVPIRVLIRSHSPQVVVGRLVLRQITEGEIRQVGDPLRVKLRLGLNSFAFSRPLTDEQRSYTYEAEFQPEWVEDEKGERLHDGPPPGDRVQNNRASAHVVARGRRRILLLGNRTKGRFDHEELVKKLMAAGGGKFRIVAEDVAILDRYKDRGQLAVFLSNFDCVVLANVAADQVSEEQQEVLRSNTHDQGCGLVMIGGPDSYGAGGWQNTPVEKALPVDSEIKSLKVLGKGGLVLIMHASEMADGNLWQKRIAKLAVERLGPADEVGVIDFDFQARWHIPLQQIGGNRAGILAQIDKMTPGDMPDFDPALQMAHTALMDRKKDLATRHVIIISDGDPQCTMGLLGPMKRDKITVTTVGVACHGPNEDQKMAAIAKATNGRSYSVKDPRQLPAIYIKESRLVSQSFLHEKRFPPRVLLRSGPTDRLPDLVPPLGGFVRTTPKPSPLVEVLIITPPLADQEFPVLACWHYGLGKAVAFTSDAGEPKFWSRDWVEGDGGRGAVYARFWEQVIDWSLRPTESGRLNMTTEYRDGKVRVTVEARTEAGQPDTGLRLRGGLTPPGRRPGEPIAQKKLPFVEKNSGVYEVEVKAEEAGSYFITAQAVRKREVNGKEVEEGVDSVRTGVTLPYSPEFAELESNTALLQRLREQTSGQAYADDDVLLAEAARSGAVFRPAPDRFRSLLPVWHWLLFWACLLLLCDVAVRRLAIDWPALAARAEVIWARLRGQPVLLPAAEPLERLQNRPVSGRAGQRFQGGPAPAGAPPSADTSTAAPPPGRAETGETPALRPDAPASEEAGDYASRLLRAKREALDKRKKEGPSE